MVPIEIRRTFEVASRRNLRIFVAVLGLALVAAGLEATGVSLVFGFIKIIQAPSALQTLPLPDSLRDAMAAQSHNDMILVGAIGIAVFYAAKNAFLALNFYVNQVFLEKVSVETAVRLFSSYQNAPYIEIKRRNSSELIQNIYLLSQAFSGAIFSPLITLISEMFVMASIIAVMFVANPQITAITMGMFCVTLFVFHGSLRRYYLALSRITTEGNRRVLQKAQETLGSLKEVKVLGREAFFRSNFEAARREIAPPRVRMAFVGQLPRFITETLLVVLFSMVVGVVLGLDLQTESVFPILGLYAFAGFRLLPSLNRILADLGKMKAGSIEIDRIYHDIKTERPVPDGYSPVAEAPKAKFTESIVFRNVGMRYPDGSGALRDVSFAASKNSTVGIMGPSGSGKTTLMDILIGLLTPTEGRVEIDGRDMTTADRGWRRNIGFVPQDMYIIDDTLRRNIAFGVSDAEIDEQAVLDAVQMAALGAVVENLSEGLDTVLQEHGSRLSGGQRQRIGIARALYHKPQVLILDEATSALDAETEREVLATLEHLAGSATIFIVAHRPSMVQHCDQILFLENGMLTASGTFDELQAGNSAFRQAVFDSATRLRSDGNSESANVGVPPFSAGVE